MDGENGREIQGREGKAAVDEHNRDELYGKKQQGGVEEENV